MLTDEQLILEVRRELCRELAHVEPPAGLIEAVWDQPRPAAEGRRGRGLALVVAAAVPVAAVVLAIVLLVHTSPQSSPLPAVRSATSQSPTLNRAMRPLTSILGVLRRPRSMADRNQALIRAIGREQQERTWVAYWGRPVASLARLATVTPWGQRIYVVPSLKPTPAEKRRVPRKDTLSGYSTVSLWAWAVSGDKVTDFFGGPNTAPYIKSGRALGNGAYDEKAYNHPRQWLMVVPDGVAKVTLWLATRSDLKHPRHPTGPHMTASVRNNIAAFVAPPKLAGPPDQTSIGPEVWYAPNGSVVKRIANASACKPPLGNCA